MELVAEEAREARVARRRGGRHEREDRGRAGRTPWRSRGGGGPRQPRSAPRARRDSLSTASSPCEESGRWRPERSGRDRSARETSCAPSRPGSSVRVRSVQVHDRPVERAEAGQRVAVALPGSSARTFVAATRSSRRVPTPLPTGSTSRSTSSRRSRTGARARPPRDGRHFARVVRVGDRWAQLRLLGSVVAARGDHVVLRGETTVGGGLVLDPAPPRHATPAASSSSNVATSRRWSTPRSADALGHLDGEPEGVGDAGEWVFSAEWLAELVPSSGRGSRRRPAGPRCPGPRQPWADVLPLPASSAGARASTFQARSGGSASGRRGRGARGGLAAAGFTPIPPTTPSWRPSWSAGLVRLVAASRSAPRLREAKRLMVVECERGGLITLARFRDLSGPGGRRAAPPRALRRRRHHEARRRRARAAPPGQDRLSYVSRGAAWAWWPSRSSKPVRRGSPTLGRFDSCAAPFALTCS